MLPAFALQWFCPPSQRRVSSCLVNVSDDAAAVPLSSHSFLWSRSSQLAGPSHTHQFQLLSITHMHRQDGCQPISQTGKLTHSTYVTWSNHAASWKQSGTSSPVLPIFIPRVVLPVKEWLDLHSPGACQPWRCLWPTIANEFKLTAVSTLGGTVASTQGTGVSLGTRPTRRLPSPVWPRGSRLLPGGEVGARQPAWASWHVPSLPSRTQEMRGSEQR